MPTDVARGTTPLDCYIRNVVQSSRDANIVAPHPVRHDVWGQSFIGLHAYEGKCHSRVIRFMVLSAPAKGVSKMKRLALAFSVFFLAVGLGAQDSQDFHAHNGLDTSDSYDLARSGIGANVQNATYPIYFWGGYIDGVIDGTGILGSCSDARRFDAVAKRVAASQHQQYSGPSLVSQSWNLPSNVTNGEIVSVVMKYLQENPSTWHLKPGDNVRNALIKAYPCEPNP